MWDVWVGALGPVWALAQFGSGPAWARPWAWLEPRTSGRGLSPGPLGPRLQGTAAALESVSEQVNIYSQRKPYLKGFKRGQTETCLGMGTGSAFNFQKLQSMLENLRNRIQCLCRRIQCLYSRMECFRSRLLCLCSRIQCLCNRRKIIINFRALQKLETDGDIASKLQREKN